MDSKTKHGLFVCTLSMIIIYTLLLQTEEPVSFNPWVRYGIPWTAILYLVSLQPFILLPHVLCTLSGLFWCNSFSRKPLKGNPKSAPFICIRVVTKGTYPKLVRSTVRRNLDTCSDFGLENFTFEVVTDEAIGLDSHPKIKEIVVPTSYRTKKGALFKARALQYCLEDSINVLDDSAWILHLDEETVITKSSLIGVLNFVMDGKHSFGQGAITYASLEVVNWVTTLNDTLRVSDDASRMRFELSTFHKSVFGWKGSFLVAKVGAERDISFDHGPEGSISEDSFLAMLATSKGYTFDFIEGEMWEQSTFTIADQIRQRRRWYQGLMLIGRSKSIPIANRILMAMTWWYMVTSPLAILILYLFPLPPCLVFRVIDSLFVTMRIGGQIFGTFSSYSLSRYGLFRVVMCFFGVGLLMPVNIFVSTTSMVMVFFGKKRQFHIVQKEKKS